MAKKAKAFTEEERKEMNFKRLMEDLTQEIKRGQIPKPTRYFNVGDSVKIGHLANIKVVEVLFDGYGYHVSYDYQDRDTPLETRYGIWSWINVFPMTSYCVGEPMRTVDDVQIRFYNNNLDCLLGKVYSSHAGVDFNPNYQRDLVWTDEQKTSLLDSIFNNIDIGKFTFIKHPYVSNMTFLYEILDGKQRLSTLCEFYEDRITYKGKKFSELCAIDANHFMGFPIIQGEVGEITEQQVYKLFVKMNTSGTPVDPNHMNKIKSLIK
jgi:hypothetical protein